MRTAATWAIRSGVAGVVLMLATSVHAQSSPCQKPSGMTYLTSSAAGGNVIREGRGFGAVSLNDSQADVERAWGRPAQCSARGAGIAYGYFLSDDGGKTAPLYIGVTFDRGAVEYIAVTLIPHSKGEGPRVQSGRGISLGALILETQSVYGTPDDPDARVWTFGSQGIGFVVASGHVGGFVVFPRGAVPRALRDF
jgi:hypothetical protein